MAKVRKPTQFIYAVVDGQGWLRRQGDLRRIHKLWTANRIDGVYTRATLPDFSTAVSRAARRLAVSFGAGTLGLWWPWRLLDAPKRTAARTSGSTDDPRSSPFNGGYVASVLGERVTLEVHSVDRLCSFGHLFEGLTNRSLRELVAGLIDGYTAPDDL